MVRWSKVWQTNKNPLKYWHPKDTSSVSDFPEKMTRLLDGKGILETVISYACNLLFFRILYQKLNAGVGRQIRSFDVNISFIQS